MAGQLTAETAKLIDRHRNTGVLLDTNLLVLWIVGASDRTLIARHKRTKAFTVEDFEILTQIVARCSQRSTTPNVLTETVNLLAQTEHHSRDQIVQRFAREVVHLRESYFRSSDLVLEPRFSEIRLTDASLLRAAQRGRLIVSADFKLCGLIATVGGAVINFNRLRKIG